MTFGRCVMCKNLAFLYPIWDISGRFHDHRCCVTCARKVNAISGGTKR